MLGLQRKFGDEVICVDNPQTLHLGSTELYINDKKALVCKAGRTSFVICDSVFVFYAENRLIWYTRYDELAEGVDVVYCMNMDSCVQRRGIIDEDGYFLYINDGAIYCENKDGDSMKVCTVDGVGYLAALTQTKDDMSICGIEKAFGMRYGFYRYTDAEFYKDLNDLHTMVSSIDEERQSNEYNSTLFANIIFKVIKVCCKMDKSVSKRLKALVKKEMMPRRTEH